MKIYSLTIMTLTLIQGHRVMRNLQFVQSFCCKMEWSSKLLLILWERWLQRSFWGTAIFFSYLYVFVCVCNASDVYSLKYLKSSKCYQVILRLRRFWWVKEQKFWTAGDWLAFWPFPTPKFMLPASPPPHFLFSFSIPMLDWITPTTRGCCEKSQESSWTKPLSGKHLPEGNICKTPKNTSPGGSQNLTWKDWAVQPWLRRQEGLEPCGSS